MVMPYHLHMPSYFLETFTEYPYSGYFKGKPSTKERRTSKSSGVILIV